MTRRREIMVGLVISLGVAMTLIPMIAAASGQDKLPTGPGNGRGSSRIASGYAGLLDLALRRRLLTLGIAAVMLALAAEEWREKRDRLELADRALRSVVEEMRSNLEELTSAGVRNTERLEAARIVLEELEAARRRGPTRPNPFTSCSAT